MAFRLLRNDSIYERPVRNGSSKFGNFVGQCGVGDFGYVSAGYHQAGTHPGFLSIDGTGDLPAFIQEYLPTLSGKSSVLNASGSNSGSGASILHLPPMPPAGASPPGKGEDLHYLS